jgi:hypothetical protein
MAAAVLVELADIDRDDLLPVRRGLGPKPFQEAMAHFAASTGHEDRCGAAGTGEGPDRRLDASVRGGARARG